ncbi:Exocyst complex subunit protein [Dioscorea alata]|uniref:Exocyst complex subunit protein n=1 Tax=Dioscorea alata TaxID=55571 RepID=A0ACB7UMT9_DIOAL|nr:Exocyst complex subunit protein [Dioscorea alata]
MPILHRTSKELSNIEGDLLSMRNLLSTQVAVICELTQGNPVESLCADSGGFVEDDLSNFEYREPSYVEKLCTELADKLEILVAERRVDEALDALDEAELVAAEAKANQTLRTAELLSLEITITQNRRKLADQLAEVAFKSSARGIKLHGALLALRRLGDGPRAHNLLLNGHHERLQRNMKSIQPTSTSYGAYTDALSQLVFSAIAQAMHDSQAVFADDSGYASELVQWSTKRAEAFVQLVKNHVLDSCADDGGLRAATECIQTALGHCSLLEAQGFSLSWLLLQHFRPIVEEALDAKLKIIEGHTAELAAADDWVLIHPPSLISSYKTSSTAAGSQPKLSKSAHCFHSMVQDLLEDVSPLLSMQFAGSTLDGFFRVFDSYINLLINALPCSVEDEANIEVSGNKMVSVAETEEQQLALLVNASVLAEVLLPQAATKLAPIFQDSNSRQTTSDRSNFLSEIRKWKRKLQCSVDRLRVSFCNQQMFALILTEYGDCLFNAEMYLNIDGRIDDPEWSPSPVFQDLFRKLRRMASIAADMFVGRERFASLLMMKVLQTFISLISDDQEFWAVIEKGPRPLGHLGLQQFYLDMQFVLAFGQSRFLSRQACQLIKDIIERAMVSFSITGMDPDSVLPDDDWFVAIARETVNIITGRSRTGTSDRDVSSPTASLSALSLSSFRSLESSNF